LLQRKDYFQILDIAPTIQDSKNAKNIKLQSPEISFSNVSLNFGEKVALSDATFTIKPNSTVAIVGKSGGGKTSIANLLVRFYNPSSGEILINNNKLEDFTLNSLRSQIALVTQDTMLFDASVAENISYGTKATSKEIIEAAKKAHADEFITLLPNGYNTIIGPQASTLSGG
jgi:subfamily B ATP-binding cassette protein MsbA